MKVHWKRVGIYYLVSLIIGILFGLDGFLNGFLIGTALLCFAYLIDKPLIE